VHLIKPTWTNYRRFSCRYSSLFNQTNHKNSCKR